MLEQSRFALGKVTTNDAFLDIACFDTQQAIEFILKAVLMDYGIKYDKSHNIHYWLDRVKETGFIFDKMEELDELADTVTSWEYEGRYGDGVRVQVQTVQRVIDIYMSISDAYLNRQESNQI